jgi:Bacterial dnaA protein helix-turn-helix
MQFFQTEATMRGTSQRAGIWRLSLEQIEATVADHLGRGRVLGNQRGPCFSRQISMYLAKNVGGWSTTRIGRFYNGRHHTTVLYAIGKIERLRKTDESIDGLIEELIAVLSPKMECRFTERFEPGWSTGLIEAVAARVLDRIAGGREGGATASFLMNTTTQIKDGAR